MSILSCDVNKTSFAFLVILLFPPVSISLCKPLYHKIIMVSSTNF
ncbi:hypothetical protein [Lactococcus phage PMBT68]|nr:hypothetical protein [Lactococcus phage P1411]